MISKYSTFEGEISKRLTLSANSPLALVVYRLTICLKLSKLFKFLFSKNSFNAILTGILELIRFNLGLIFTRNTRNARFLEINTDNFSFGFCCGKLRYIIINCELDLGVKIIGTDNIESNIYDVFSVYRMVEDLSKIDFEEFFIEHYFKYRNTIAHAGKDSGNWYVAFEF